jgi:hypothetical protein
LRIGPGIDFGRHISLLLDKIIISVLRKREASAGSTMTHNNIFLKPPQYHSSKDADEFTALN